VKTRNQCEEPSLGAVPVADDLLVDAAKAGSTKAFDVLVGRYRARVFNLAYRLTRDVDDANDVAQDVFLRAYARLGEFESRRSLAGWILLTARNAAIDSIRRQRRSVALVAKMQWLLHDFVDPEDLVVKNEEAALVRTAIASLPERYRVAIELYYLRDMSYTDIASALDMPIGTIKTFLFRAKTRLSANLSDAKPVTRA